jgi:flagellar biosynthesis/type III secretory pathway protein FliH
MPGPLTISLSGPVTSVRILDNHPATIEGAPHLNGRGTELPHDEQMDSQAGAGQVLVQDSEARKAAFSQVCQALNGVVARFNEFCGKVFAQHKEDIARLSLEIARKILVQKVENGDYEIEAIVKETLTNAPGHQDVVVHLNPQDLAQCQKAQQDEPAGAFCGIKFVSDPNIGRAECLLESPKGIIESVIEQHLERIGKALKKAE